MTAANDQPRLEGKVAVVTGAASGIGLALVRRAAASGMSVVMADIDAERLVRAREMLGLSEADAIVVPTDVSCAEAVRELAAITEKTFGAPWLLVNNAGVSVRLRTWDLTHEDWSWVLAVNLFGVIHGVEAFLPGMVERDEGHIVNTASMAGLVVAASSSGPYVASKHAIVGLSEVLHRELEALGSGVRISVLCPGPVATDISFSGRHRPERFGGPAVPRGAFDTSRHGQGSLAPDDVAEYVFGAVHSGQFWVLTHAAEFGKSIVARMKGAVDGRNPDESTEDPLIARVPWDAGTRETGASVPAPSPRNR